MVPPYTRDSYKEIEDFFCFNDSFENLEQFSKICAYIGSVVFTLVSGHIHLKILLYICA